MNASLHKSQQNCGRTNGRTDANGHEFFKRLPHKSPAGNYWSESSLLPYKTFLEREKHEKQGPELRYRLYLDDLGRFWWEIDEIFSDFLSSISHQNRPRSPRYNRYRSSGPCFSCFSGFNGFSYVFWGSYSFKILISSAQTHSIPLEGSMSFDIAWDLLERTFKSAFA